MTTILLLPDRYAQTGHMTQRLFEAVLAGCLPLTPLSIRDAARFTPAELHIANGADAARKVSQMKSLVGTARHAELLVLCLERLELFRLSRQLDTVDQILADLGSHRVS